MAVRRRPSYGFDIAGSTLGLRPEAGVSRSTLAQLFPEIDLGAPAAASTATEEVEKPEESTTATTPTGTGVTALAEDDTVPGSELEKYKISGSLSYAAPFNLQVGPTGPQGRGSRLGYSGGTGTEAAPASQPTATPLSQSASSFAMPELPQFDYSPFESLLAQGQSILDQIQSASQNMGAAQTTQPVVDQETKETTGETTTAPTPTTAAQRITQQAQAFGKPTSLAATGTIQLMSSGQATGTQIARQAAQGNIQLTKQAERAVVKDVVASSGPTISKSEIRAVINSGASPRQIEKQAAEAGVDIGKQAQKLIDKAKSKKK